MDKIKHYMIPEHINELFKNEAISSISLTREMGEKLNEVIDMVNEYKTLRDNKYQEQDGKIDKAIVYLKHNLKNTLMDLFEIMKYNGELDDLLNKVLFEGKVLSDIDLLKSKVKDIKDYGAIGDGLTDDTKAFIKAYEDSKGEFVIKIPTGVYRISQTIKIPSYVKTFIEGNVVILSDVKNGATLHYTSNNELTNIDELKYITNNSLVDGAIISGGNLIIQRLNNYDDINSSNDSIGLLIGDNEATINNIPVSRCNFNNITISGFKKAIAINPVNTYLLTFNHIHTENDYYGVFIGGKNRVNSGENITFNNCIFSHHYHAICNEFEYMCGLNFNNCAFDFNANHVLQNTHGNVLFNFNGCHFEGVGYSDETQIKANSSTLGFSSIFHRNSDNKYTRSLCVFEGCYFHLGTFTPGDHLFTAKATSRPYSSIKLSNYGISWDYKKLTPDNRFMCDENTEIELSAPNHCIDYQAYNGSDKDILGKFEHIPDDLTINYTNDEEKETLHKLGYELSANDWSSTPVNVTINKTNTVFNKALLVEQNSMNTNCGLIRVVENLSKNYISNVSYFKLGNITLDDTTITDYKMKPQIRYRFYDKYDNLIEEKLIPCDDYNYIKNGWVVTSTIAKIPVGACKCNLLSNVVLKYNEAYLNFKGSVLFGGDIIEMMD